MLYINKRYYFCHKDQKHILADTKIKRLMDENGRMVLIDYILESSNIDLA